jgi:aminoglycoside phosphotransferase family enzyme
MNPGAAPRRRRGAAELARKLAFLGDPRSYPHRPARVRALETHFAYVFLAGKYAFKLKKPARQAGMDYRTLAARRRGCEQELRLNRRLAPTVYLAVIPLTLRQGRLRLDGRGRIVDYLVMMRRLPATATLDHALVHGTPRLRDLAPTIELLARFYGQAVRAPLAPRRYRSRFEAQIGRNLRALRAQRALIDWQRARRITDLQREFLKRAARIVGARGEHLVDAHGDLRAEHVCLRPLAVIDCLEFDRTLRRLDPHEDVALLALEIERCRPALARAFLRRLAARLGDPVPAALTHIYMSHRALTRAKLAAWHLGDPQFPDLAPWLSRTESYLRSAERHARAALRSTLRYSRARPTRRRPPRPR